MRKDRAFRNETVWLTLNRMAQDVAPTLAELARASGYSEQSVLRSLDDLIEDGKAWHYDWRKVHGRYLRSYKPGEMPKGFKLQITPPKGRSDAQRKLDHKHRKSAANKAEREAAREAKRKADAEAKAAREAARKAERERTAEARRLHRLAVDARSYEKNRDEILKRRRARYAAERDARLAKRKAYEAKLRKAASVNPFAQLIKGE